MNKRINSFSKILACVLFFFLSSFNNYAQDTIVNKYGLQVISSIKGYQASIRDNPGKDMLDLKKLIPSLTIDLKYAGANNFMETKVYPKIKTTYLRKPAAAALAAVQRELKENELGLKIFDAYRPYAVTEKMWELVKDDRYAADPKKGSGHNRGISVDLTIIDLQTKRPLDMGTTFDDFSDTAHHDFQALPKEVLLNRLLLRNIMEKNGFKALETEWWHYSFSNGIQYELLDLSFEQLRKLKI
ncbi:MAG: M15 family metallopeptidase [Ferruginibacter sp.]